MALAETAKASHPQLLSLGAFNLRHMRELPACKVCTAGIAHCSHEYTRTFEHTNTKYCTSRSSRRNSSRRRRSSIVVLVVVVVVIVVVVMVVVVVVVVVVVAVVIVVLLVVVVVVVIVVVVVVIVVVVVGGGGVGVVVEVVVVGVGVGVGVVVVVVVVVGVGVGVAVAVAVAVAAAAAAAAGVVVVVVVVVGVAVAVAVAAAAGVVVVVVVGVVVVVVIIIVIRASRVRDGMISQHAKSCSIVDCSSFWSYYFAVGLVLFGAIVGMFMDLSLKGVLRLSAEPHCCTMLYDSSGQEQGVMKRALVKRRNGGKQLHRCIACGACDHRVDVCAFTDAGPKLSREKLVKTVGAWEDTERKPLCSRCFLLLQQLRG